MTSVNVTRKRNIICFKSTWKALFIGGSPAFPVDSRAVLRLSCRYLDVGNIKITVLCYSTHVCLCVCVRDRVCMCALLTHRWGGLKVQCTHVVWLLCTSIKTNLFSISFCSNVVKLLNFIFGLTNMLLTEGFLQPFCETCIAFHACIERHRIAGYWSKDREIRNFFRGS